MGSGKLTQVPQFLLEDEEEEIGLAAAATGTIFVVRPTTSGNSNGDNDYKDNNHTSWSPSPDASRLCPLPIALPRRGDAPPPGAAGSSVGYMVHNDRWGHLPSCQIIYMMIGMLLKMLVSDRGGAVAAADDVDNGGLLYGNDDNNNFDDKE